MELHPAANGAADSEKHTVMSQPQKHKTKHKR